MRKNDIKELLSFTSLLLSDIEKEKDQKKHELFKPRIKSCLENLRSCLDYSAQDIYGLYKTKVDSNKLKKFSRVYFPYAEDQKKFKSILNTNFPDLNKLMPNIYGLIESIQPYKCEDSWLIDLCMQTNRIKHNELTKQNKVESKTVKLFGNVFNVKGQNIKMKGNTLNGIPQSNDIVIKNNELLSDVSLNGPDIIIYDSVGFFFKDTSINIFELIKNSHEKIDYFTQQLYPKLNN